MNGWLVTIGLVLVIVGLFRIRRPRPGRLGRSKVAGPASHTYGLFDAKTEERRGARAGACRQFSRSRDRRLEHTRAREPVSGLPDEQQIKPTIRRRRSSTSTTAFAKAVDTRSEICEACAPAPDMAESINAIPVRRDLHVPGGPPLA